MQGVDELVRETPAFEDLDEEQLALLAGCGANVHFEAGARLFREGDPAETFYLLRHGTVVLETWVPGRGAVQIETLGPGEVVGWSWLFRPYTWHFDGRAVAPVRATSFDGACLRRKCADDPALGYALMQSFARIAIDRLQWTRRRLLDVYGAVHAG